MPCRCRSIFRALGHPRRDTVLVAAAGPGINIVLAFLAAEGFHVVGYLPGTVINVVLAVFNLVGIEIERAPL